MLDPEAAWREIHAHLAPLEAVDIPRDDALGRVLAADVPATADLPPADVSAMDGYALAGTADPGSTLPVVGISAAGHPPTFRLAAGQAAKIMTGAMVPEGADRVIPVELTDSGSERVTIEGENRHGDHIRRRAEVLATGAPLLSRGHDLNAGALSMLASHGYGTVPAIRAPEVAILTTGDEVLPPEAEPGPGQLRDSNTSFLLAACRGLGIRAHSLGIASDRRDELEGRIRRGLEADVLLLCGGVSKGDYDFVEDVLTELGCRMLFDAVAIQPGKPLVAAVQGGSAGAGAGDGITGDGEPRRWVFGLPGNPGSVMVTFWLFVRPTLRCLAGLGDGYWHGALPGVLEAPLPATKGRDRFLPALARIGEAGLDDLGRGDHGLRVKPITSKGSHDTLGFGFGNVLVRAPKKRPETPAGSPCQVLPLDPGSLGARAPDPRA
ncbi:MAG: molybdopterin molybdotransferase MoeA [Holophagales bacterium]|nr:molybdopterin molybdotransferase MoeA [Holophagales bacterium]